MVENFDEPLKVKHLDVNRLPVLAGSERDRASHGPELYSLEGRRERLVLNRVGAGLIVHPHNRY